MEPKYMWIIGILIVGILLLGVLNYMGVFCSPVSEPVCGGDGKTYLNECRLRATGLTSYSPGVCVNCIDTDNGKDISHAGTTHLKDSTGSYSDLCQNPTTVLEYYCNGDTIASDYLSCPTGQSCVAGACVAACLDSDNGTSPYVVGTTSLGAQVNTDSCVGTNVRKYYCSNNTVTSALMPCPSGYACSGGACIISTLLNCTDSEVPSSLFVSGTVTKNSIIYQDSCSGTNTVLEYSCSGNTVAQVNVSCPSGTFCSGGACTNSSCIDADGTNIYLKSNVTTPSGVYVDTCIDYRTVKEYYCLGTSHTLTSANYECPSGYDCTDGACNLSTICHDTDGGQDEDERGTVSQGTTHHTDYCEDDNSVLEYYCNDDGNMDSIAISCDSDEFCDDGECVLNTTISPPTPTPTCTDSDGGRVYSVAGSTASSDGTSGTDECVSGSTTMLREYYCNDAGTVAHEDYTCPSGQVCSVDHCVVSIGPPTLPVCTDTDGGENYRIPGTTDSSLDDDPPVHDSCSDRNTIIESFCQDDGSVKTLSARCPDGTQCKVDACVATSVTCTDTDGGRNYGQGGIATLSDDLLHPKKDICTDTSTLTEYHCDGLIIVPETHSCGSGEVCDADHCVDRCTDSDGGSDRRVLGQVSYDGEEEYDYCQMGGKQIEYYCNPSGIGFTHYPAADCYPGTHCLDGECVDDTCTDSDGGLFPLVAGSVTVTDRSGRYTSEDTCSAGGSGYADDAVVEMTCDPALHTLLTHHILCSEAGGSAYFGCPSGSHACVPTCTDSDGGKLYTMKGTLHFGNDAARTDYCGKSNTLVEYYCSSDGLSWHSEMYSCADHGMVCSTTQGRCVPG